MQKLLWDMLQADRFAGVYIVPKFDSIKRDSAVFSLYDKVFQIHKITKDEFLKSYKFYLGRPDIMKTMFDSISAGAERRRADVYKRKIPDSLRKKVL